MKLRKTFSPIAVRPSRWEIVMMGIRRTWATSAADSAVAFDLDGRGGTERVEWLLPGRDALLAVHIAANRVIPLWQYQIAMLRMPYSM